MKYVLFADAGIYPFENLADFVRYLVVHFSRAGVADNPFIQGYRPASISRTYHLSREFAGRSDAGNFAHLPVLLDNVSPQLPSQREFIRRVIYFPAINALR